MIDDDLTKLANGPTDKPLDHLEADVWAGVAARRMARRTGRIIASCQAAVMLVALVGAAAAGASTAAVVRSPGALITSAGADYAPSTLLLGQRP